MRKGFSLIELLTVLGIIVFIFSVSFLALSSSRRKTDFDQTKIRIATLLSDAQSRSVNQDSGVSWGVHFENAVSGPFYALFSATYSPAREKGHYVLPSGVGYVTSTLPVGSVKEIMFEAVSGYASSSGSIDIQLLTAPYTSSSISVSASGAVSY
jgi:prepilin-type N-terminal cleavage/methylation domain-containing protein